MDRNINKKFRMAPVIFLGREKGWHQFLQQVWNRAMKHDAMFFEEPQNP